MNTFPFKTGVVLSAMLGILTLAHGQDAPSPVLCLQNIQRNCVGLENDLETCMNQRANQFDLGCVSFLRDAIGQSKNSQGMGACVSDIKRLCVGADVAAITECITTKHDQFSPECLKQLDAKAGS